MKIGDVFKLFSKLSLANDAQKTSGKNCCCCEIWRELAHPTAAP